VLKAYRLQEVLPPDTVVLFDTATTPVSASVTYAQAANTVTVTKTAHGLIYR
jgi:hypothetical protein